MALLSCRECSKPVSSEASACPHCGCPVKASPKKQQPRAESDEESLAALHRAEQDSIARFQKGTSSPQQTAAASPAEQEPLLRRTGILVTNSLIDLHGRSYSVPQLNAIKIDKIPHPKTWGLVVVMLPSLAIGGIILFLDLLLILVGDHNESDFTKKVVGMLIVGVICLLPAYFCYRALKRLPPWALLRFQMSSGDVKALEEERKNIDQVASAIRTAMSRR